MEREDRGSGGRGEGGEDRGSGGRGEDGERR